MSIYSSNPFKAKGLYLRTPLIASLQPANSEHIMTESFILLLMFLQITYSSTWTQRPSLRLLHQIMSELDHRASLLTKFGFYSEKMRHFSPYNLWISSLNLIISSLIVFIVPTYFLLLLFLSKAYTVEPMNWIKHILSL